MKHSRKSIRRKAHAIPKIKFEQQQLTSFAGLVLLQPFLAAINFKASLAYCFRHTRAGKVYGRATVFLQLVIHLLLGYRDLRESTHYRDDPMVKRLLGLKRLPDVSTLSRVLKDADAKTVEKLRGLLRRLVIARLRKLDLSRVTLDFDGSVQSTRRRAAGTAVGFNKKKVRIQPRVMTKRIHRGDAECAEFDLSAPLSFPEHIPSRQNDWNRPLSASSAPPRCVLSYARIAVG